MNYEVSESKKIRVFSDLNAWREAHQLVIIIYKTTRSFPKEEVFSLTDQMRRCAISITSNIAEGFSRQSYKEKVQFYSIALGSTTELQSQLLIARDVGYLADELYNTLNEQTVKTHKIINGLIKASRRSGFIIHNS
jgi:four helix bundle protein